MLCHLENDLKIKMTSSEKGRCKKKEEETLHTSRLPYRPEFTPFKASLWHCIPQKVQTFVPDNDLNFSLLCILTQLV